MPSVALVTCRELASGDEDAEALTTALAKLDIDASWQAWDDPGVDWSKGLTVVRSTWDYTGKREEFLAWTRTVARLENCAEVIAWNSDKTYLRDLADAGVPIVATEWVPPGSEIELPSTAEYVVKPSVGAGSMGAGRFDAIANADGAAMAHIAQLHAAGRTVMIQPYLVGIDDVGEAALIYLDGQFSHAVTKAAMLAKDAVFALSSGYSHGLFIEERITPRRPSREERAVGEQVMDVLKDRRDAPLYARVDLLPGPDGPVLVELELTEPSLFLGAAGAAERFATAIARRA